MKRTQRKEKAIPTMKELMLQHGSAVVSNIVKIAHIAIIIVERMTD